MTDHHRVVRRSADPQAAGATRRLSTVARRAATPATILGLLAATGCAAPESAPRGGDVPTTARSLAFVAAEHAGPPSSASAEDDAAGEFAGGGVGTELRYRTEGDHDGDTLVVAVGTGLDEALVSCDTAENESVSGCARTGSGTLLWQDMAPGEDPGGVYVAVPKGEAHVLLFSTGPRIDGDPRELDLPVSVETLFAIADDDRVDLTTSRAAVDAGEDLSFWRR